MRPIRRSWLGLILLLAGCAGSPLQYPQLPPPAEGAPTAVELKDTAFHPQQAYQCGPAALATLLQSSGVSDADPERLADQVYLPERRGSLQTELLAATRRADRVPYPLAPRFEDLLQEVRAGHPVLVMQNLQLPRWPQWHYAVVIGFDQAEETVILRSGETRRLEMSFRRFERTWQMADYWALVVPREGDTPVTARANRYLAAVAALEEQQRWQPARQGYLAASQRWPENPNSYLGLGNMSYQQQDYPQAEQHFRAAISVDAQAPAAYYNLAWALLRQGELEASREAADKAQQLAPDHPRYGQASQELRDADAG